VKHALSLLETISRGQRFASMVGRIESLQFARGDGRKAPK